MLKVNIKQTVSLALVFFMLFGIFSITEVESAQAAGNTYYVDTARPDDSGNGQSPETAWKTLDAVNARTFQPGDRILLKAGGVWNDQYLDLKGSGTAANPIIVDKYGEGDKPVIDFGNTDVGGYGFGVRLKNVSYWEINNLEITSGQFPEGKVRNGVWVVGEGPEGGNFKHIYIRNVDAHDIFGATRRSGGINFHAKYAEGGAESAWDDILVESCTVINVADTGIQTMTDVLINDSPAALAWAHRYDAFTNLRIRNNYVEKIHRDGILARASTGAVIEHNVTNLIGDADEKDIGVVNYLDNIGWVAAQWVYSSKSAVLQYNEAFNTRKLVGDGQPWDFDEYVYDSVYQYNYSHDNEGGTLLICGNTDNNTFRFNISQNDMDGEGKAFNNYSAGTLNIYNNTFYRGPGIAEGAYLTSASTGSGMTYYTNNIFYNASTSTYDTSSKAVYSNNLYYGANSALTFDPEGIAADPLLVNPGEAGIGISTASAYKLQPSSYAINAGQAISGYTSGQDFFGNPYPAGDAPDIGAHEFEGTPEPPDQPPPPRTDPEPEPEPEPEPVPVPVVVPDGTLLTDDFEDGDSTGWIVTGATWSVVTDGNGSKVLKRIGSNSEAVATSGDSVWTDYIYQAKYRLDSAWGVTGPIFRYSDNNNYYMFRINHANNKWELMKKVAGTFTTLADGDFHVNLGQWYTMNIYVSGNNIRGYIDGVQMFDWTNPITELTSGAIGMRTRDTSSMDDVLVGPIPPEPEPILNPTERIDAMRELLDGYEASGDIGKPLFMQLGNDLKRVEQKVVQGKSDMAVKHTEDFKKHLNNEAMNKFVSENAKATLNANADALIEALLN